MIVGFTGTQAGMTKAQEGAVFDWLRANRRQIGLADHGGCVGADAQFHLLCEESGIATEIYPSNIPGKRANLIGDVNHPPMPPLKRNKIIVKRCTVLIAAPKEDHEILRSGTWATIRYARKSKRRVVLFWPNGYQMEVTA